MDLQYALLLIGLLIVGGVAFTSYFGRYRLAERWRARRDATGSEEDATDTDAQPSEGEPLPEVAVLTARRESAVSGGLDINPGPPSAPDAKFLKPDALPAHNQQDVADIELYEQLEGIESAALMPLNLSLSLGHPDDHGPNGVQRRQMPDEKVDFVIRLPGRGPVNRNQALGVYKQNEYLLEKPHQIYGLGYKTGQWSNLESDREYAQYRDVAVAMQLADSRGPVNESELNTFVQLSLKLADRLHRPTKLSVTLEEAVERARDLDQFCEANDVLASVNVLSNNPGGFGGRAINQAATHLGMQFGAMNVYHLKNDNPLGCRHLFSLANLYDPGEFDLETMNSMRTSGLTLFMNVPCAYQPSRVFEKMIETARGLCDMLDGRLVDQDGRPLTESGLKVIRTQIERIASDMQNRGIVPGSETAMRLF